MADYAIGDVQGCYSSLRYLLDFIHFDEGQDRLWFVGDLINRGPHSLKVLRFIKSLSRSPHITLGNHELHLLARLFGGSMRKNSDDTIADILGAPDGEELGHWLRAQPVLYYSQELNTVMTHAGIAPVWSLRAAQNYARELEEVLRGEGYREFLAHLYGNTPAIWSGTLTGIERLRLISSYFTRMRLCSKRGGLVLNHKETNAKADVYPWFTVPGRKEIAPDIVFGHWAALRGVTNDARVHALDTGCYWGGELTAFRLQDKKRFSIVSRN